MELETVYMLTMIAATGGCILGIFYICAACIRDETSLHDVKIEARRMRMEFDRRVSARNAGAHADPHAGIDDDEEPFLTV